MNITPIPELSYTGGILLLTLSAPSLPEMTQARMAFHNYPVLARKDAVIVWFFDATELTEQHEADLLRADLPEVPEIIRRSSLRAEQ